MGQLRNVRVEGNEGQKGFPKEEGGGEKREEKVNNRKKDR